jgi:hypothetical protein
MTRKEKEFYALAVQVNAVAMKTPAIELSNFIMTLMQYKLPEHIAIE